ncbi:serine hydrolase [Catellatospora methionotrophica]|uniref:serine hydrolase n=1 Tax=Catellatospora methionotrophica TaxID=121620 RepID=UPI0033E90B58
MTMRRRIAVVLATTLAGAALSGVPARAVPGVPSPVFDPNTVSWLSLRDQTSAQFATSFTANSKNGYLIDDLDIDTTGGDYRVGSVWQYNTDGRAWKELRDLDDAGFAAAWSEAAGQGMRLTEQETYLVGGVRRWAGVWVKNVEGLSWTSFRGLTSAEFSTRFDEQRRAGRMPIDIDVYDTSQGLRYSVVWVQNAENLAWVLWRDLTSAEFSTKFTELQREYRMLAFESLRISAGQRYAGIWVENRNGRGWAERRDMTATMFGNYWHRYSDEGYRLVAYNKYDTAGGVRYAGIWRQNNDRPDWKLKNAVDTRVQTELDSTAVPGISVAVFHNNQPKYLRGFGFADIGDNVWMDSEHVGGLASVSKAVAGVLTMRMVEQGLVDLDDESRDLVPAMPAHHTHTVGDLLANRGCIGDYGDIDTSGFDNLPYATALAAADEFWDEPLVCNPPDYYYTTLGYTLLGADLEAAAGDNVKNLVRTKLTNAYGLGTLAPADMSAAVRRMTMYTDGNAEVALENKDWKTLGGGIQSNVYDLGRFGAKLAAGQILTQTSRDTMWTAPDADSGYAYGWSTGTENGHPVVAKDGSWTGTLAYLRIYPEDGIVVAVMMNDRSGTQSTTQLGRDIGAIVLNSLP